MGHYLFRATYTQAGIRGVLKEGGSRRRAAVEQLVASAGGRLETAYWAFGTDDFIAIAELPDNSAAAAVAATVAAAGTSSVSTTVLLTAEELDVAVGRSVEFRPPGA
jgi:uncharacterized protein with GYD domain